MESGCTTEGLEELGSRFGSNLKLSEKEREGICIDRKAVDGALMGFQFTLIAEVLTAKEVKGDAFVDCFMSLWRGREGVSIREIGDRRFLARFASQRDLQRVVDADLPWMFRNELVMVADSSEKGMNRSRPLSMAEFWVQMHNVPVLSKSQAVAETIGGLMGTVKTVDKTGSRDCIGRFLRVKIRFNVLEPLMRGTFVTFPDDGKLWIDFKYEALPNYCLICGKIGHPTRVCRNLVPDESISEECSKETNVALAFCGLDAVTDLRGKPLGAGARSRASSGSIGGRSNSGRWKEDKNSEPSGGRRSGRSSMASGMGNQGHHSDSKSFSGNECNARMQDEVTDTATSPSKPRWSTNKQGLGDNNVANTIKRQRAEDEDARVARELAFDAGLIGPGGEVALGVENVVLLEHPEQDGNRDTTCGMQNADPSFDLNHMPTTGEDLINVQSGSVTIPNASGAEDTTCLVRDDDPFDLETIIEAVTEECTGKKKRLFREVEYSDILPGVEPIRTKPRKTQTDEAEETSRKGSPKGQ